MNKIYFCFFAFCSWVLEQLCYCYDCVFLCSNYFLCQVKPLGSSSVIVVWSCWKNRSFCAHEKNSHFLPESDKIPIPFAVDQYKNYSGHPNVSEFLELHKYSKSLDCYRLFCFWQIIFFCIVCLFWWVYGFLWWVFAIEKLEFRRYNSRTKYE